jgi:predicted PurR-regulated permease PerM
MESSEPRARLRLSNRSVALTAAVFALTLLALRVFIAAGRVIGWMLVAAALAGLLHPLVSLLARYMRRALAAVLIMFVGVTVTGFVIRGMVTDVVSETQRLRAAAYEATGEIQSRGSLADFATTIRLQARTDRFIKAVPELLSGGGTAADRFRAAATRGVAFLATAVLTLFLLMHGPRMAHAAADQIADEDDRERLRRVCVSAFRRAFGYARGTLLQAGVAGSLAYLLARGADVRGAGALAVWVAMWDVVPVAGAAIGAAPIVVLASVQNPMYGVLIAIAFMCLQVAEDVLWQPALERRTIRLGPFLTVLSGLIGLEIRGLSGALLAVLFTALAVALLDDLATTAEDPRGEATAKS